MKTIATFNAYHLGDNLLHLHFLRKMAAAYPEIYFTHRSHPAHQSQLLPLVMNLPNLSLNPALPNPEEINAWRGAENWFYRQPDTHDFLQINLRWFALLAEKMGLESPIRCARDLLFDYPALAPEVAAGVPACRSYDFLIVNSPPNSNQWQGFSADGFSSLACLLWNEGHEVITTAPIAPGGLLPCTQDQKLDVTAIGRLSQSVRCIIGCVTGPMWPTLNIWAKPETLRIHLLDTERVELTPNTVHTNSLTLVPEILRDRGLI